METTRDSSMLISNRILVSKRKHGAVIHLVAPECELMLLFVYQVIISQVMERSGQRKVIIRSPVGWMTSLTSAVIVSVQQR